MTRSITVKQERTEEYSEPDNSASSSRSERSAMNGQGVESSQDTATADVEMAGASNGQSPSALKKHGGLLSSDADMLGR